MFRVSARRGGSYRFAPVFVRWRLRCVLPRPPPPPTLVGMSSRTTGSDDARAIPQRGSADGWVDDAGEVYTVDVRGRRRPGSRGAAGAATAAPRRDSGGRRPAPPVDPGWDDDAPRRRRVPVVRLVLLLVAAWLA